MVDLVTGKVLTTYDSAVDAATLQHGGDLSLRVIAFAGGQAIAAQQLRGGLDALSAADKVNALPLTINSGMALLASIPATIKGGEVSFAMPTPLIEVIDSWSLYRDDVLVKTSTSALIIDSAAEPGRTYSYTVILTAPNWRGLPNVELAYEPALDECAAHAVPCTTAAASAAVPERAEGEGEVSGDGMSLVLPVDVPDIASPRLLHARPHSTPHAGATAGHQPRPSIETVESLSVAAALANARPDDDARVWFNTFISPAYINMEQPPGRPDYWFGGDNRGFSSIPGGRTRTMTRVTIDWEGRGVYQSRTASPTKRYIRNANGIFTLEGSLTTTNDTDVGFLEEGDRFRVHVRPSVGNPYEFYFPNIDYEWEYLIVADGGITARGLHDGAPHYETFYEWPFSNAPQRTYQFEATSFIELAPPMEWVGRSWCVPAPFGGGLCPGFGTARWV